MLALLASTDMQDIHVVAQIVEEPAVTHRTRNSVSPQITQHTRELKDEINKSLNSTFMEPERIKTASENMSSMGHIEQRTLKPTMNSKVSSKPVEKDMKNSSQNLDIPTPFEHPIGMADQQPENIYRNFDPFERVLLTSSIDNQILTSFRTINKSNNLISNTLKVIHDRFQPNAQNSKLKPGRTLYPTGLASGPSKD